MQDLIVWVIIAICGFFISRRFWRQWRGFVQGKGDCCSNSSCCCSSSSSVTPFPTVETKNSSQRDPE